MLCSRVQIGDICPHSKEQIELVHAVLPLIVRLLCVEDHASEMERTLAEDVYLMA